MEDKIYSDKQLIDATQVAYLDFIEDTIKNRMADGKKGPYIIKDLIMDNVDTDLLESRLKKAKEELEQAQKECDSSEGKSEELLKKLKLAKQKVIFEEEKINKMELEELMEYTELAESDKKIINSLSKNALNWKIVDIHDRNGDSGNGFYGCIIETNSENAIVAFRGSESIKKYSNLVKDWKEADLKLFSSKEIEQQREVERFLDSLTINGTLNKYKSLASTGHSLGGNLASHFAIAASVGENKSEIFNKLNQVVNFDGPGNSKEYLKYHEDAIKVAGKKIKHYKWSLVGSALNDIPGEKTEFLAIDENQHNASLLDKIKYKTVSRHATTSLKFAEDGQAIRGNQDNLSKFVHSLSVGVEHAPIRLIANILVPDKIQNIIGLVATSIKKSIYQKENGSIGFKLLGDKEDEMKYKDNESLISGMILKGTINEAQNIADNELEVKKEGKSGYLDVTNAARTNPSFCTTNQFRQTVIDLKDYRNREAIDNQIKEKTEDLDKVS